MLSALIEEYITEMLPDMTRYKMSWDVSVSSDEKENRKKSISF
jgi:hypothetical protein